jgi:RecB family exonuclease
LYYPEFTISSQLSKEFNGRDNLQLLGRIDLLVIDKDGNPQIVDYKTSPKIYDDYSAAKKLGFSYQLGAYERMLRRWKINTSHTDVMVAPIQMENFIQAVSKMVKKMVMVFISKQMEINI